MSEFFKNLRHTQIFILDKIIICLVLYLLVPTFAYSSYVKHSDPIYKVDKERVFKNEKGVSSDLQQKKQISGRVVDQDGFPLPGVAITVKGSPGVGVVTDAEGSYTITCDGENLLVFSYIGFKA